MDDPDDDLRARLREAMATIGPVDTAGLGQRLTARRVARRRRHRVLALASSVATVSLIVILAATLVVARRDVGHEVNAGQPNDTPVGRGPSDTFGWAPGWHTLDPGPLASGRVASAIWTGREVVVLFGSSNEPFPQPSGLTAAAFDPVTKVWRNVAPNPLPPGDLQAVWTGREIVVVRTATGANMRLPDAAAVWNPSTDTWRLLPMPPPIVANGLEGIFWTGRDVLIPSRLAAYDPSTNAWSAMASLPPEASGSFRGAWTGSQLVLATSTFSTVTLAYDPVSNQWQTLAPPPQLQANAASFAGGRLVFHENLAQHRSVAFDARANTWAELPTVDLPIALCSSDAVTVGDTAVANWCSGVTFLRRDGSWVDVGLPANQAPPGDYQGRLLGTETVLFGLGGAGRGAGLDVFVPAPDLIEPAPPPTTPSQPPPRPSLNTGPSRAWPVVKIGAATFDVPNGFTVRPSGPEMRDGVSITVVVPLPDPPWPAEQPCTITSVPENGNGPGRTFDALRKRSRTPEMKTVNVQFGVAAGFFLYKGDYDDREHVIMKSADRAIIDVSCDRLLVATELAQYLH